MADETTNVLRLDTRGPRVTVALQPVMPQPRVTVEYWEWQGGDEWETVEPAGTFSRTEAARRIREALADWGHWVVTERMRRELNSRTHPVVSSSSPVHPTRTMHPDDDLRDQYALADGLTDERERRHGQVVDVAFYEPGAYGSLIRHCSVWLGTPDHEPVALG